MVRLIVEQVYTIYANGYRPYIGLYYIGPAYIPYLAPISTTRGLRSAGASFWNITEGGGRTLGGYMVTYMGPHIGPYRPI